LLCTVQSTVTFHGYPSVSKKVGTRVPSFLPQSQFSLETFPPLDSGTWWVWLTAASWGHPRGPKFWKSWNRWKLTMVCHCCYLLNRQLYSSIAELIAKT